MKSKIITKLFIYAGVTALAEAVVHATVRWVYETRARKLKKKMRKIARKEFQKQWVQIMNNAQIVRVPEQMQQCESTEENGD